MEFIFEVIDKSGRRIHLSKERWSHILKSHGEMVNYLEEIQFTLKNPIKIIFQSKGNLKKYYNYIKNRKNPEKFLRVIVKYLNGNGFVLTAHFVPTIR